MLCSKQCKTPYSQDKTKINVNSGVAIPIIKLEGEQKLIINNNQENKVYNIAVKNYDENEQITQVELEYYIEISVCF